MTGERARVLRVGARVRLQDVEYDVSGLDGLQVWLTAHGGSMMTILSSDLLRDSSFALISDVQRGPIAPSPMFDGLPADVQARARDMEQHVTEVLDGVPAGAPPGTIPRVQYQPEVTTVSQREQAKLAELKAAGTPVTLRTFQRMRAQYVSRGVMALVDQRKLRRSKPTGRTDPRVVEALRRVLASNTHDSSGTVDRLRRAVKHEVAEQYPDEDVPLPSRSAFHRLLDGLHEARHATGSARTRRTAANSPDRAFGSVIAIRPGEITQIDSTPLDVAVILDDGVVGRVELTALVDVATRTIAAAVLRPTTKGVDAALLLARAMTPEPMRPGWSDAVQMAHSVLPYEHLVEIDVRLRDAAAKPVIIPETVVYDHGKVFVSNTFRAACRSLGISLQPAHPDTPTDKAIVERTLGSVATLFAEKVSGYLGSSVERRGRNAEGKAAFTVLELQNLLDEWIVTVWQNRPHDGLRDPLVSSQRLTPNEKYGALLSVAGYVPVPLTDDDYIRLLPTCPRVINSYGIKIDHRVYDSDALNPFRGQKSGIAALKGRWQVHHDPYDVSRVWIAHPDGEGWIVAYWRQLRAAPQPFGRDAWEHGRRIVADRGEVVSEESITAAVDSVLNRASATKSGSSRQRRKRADARIAAKNATTAVTAPTAGSSRQNTPEPAALLAEEDQSYAKVIPLPVFDPSAEAKSWW